MNVKTDNNQTVIAGYTYGDSNERLILEEAGVRTYYACDGSAEYTESGSSITPQWSKTYIYLGARLLSTLTPNGSGGQFVQYHNPDRLGTRLVTNAQDTNYFEQQTLPFGTALNESPPAGGTTGETKRRFTTYDRSLNTGLDYALNRHYDAHQGRFTQVDPIEMVSVELDNPQMLNLYAYCVNDPVNSIDPSGLGFFSFMKKVFKGIWKVISSKWFMIAVTVALTVISFGASMGWWALAEKITKIISIGMDLGHGTQLATATVIQTTTLGWIAAGLSTAAAIPTVTSVRAILQRLVGFGFGQAVGRLGGSVGVGGTPDWNPAGNNFQKGWRPGMPRRGLGFRSWRSGLGRPRRQGPGFRNLKDHAKRHSELTPGQYYYEAFLHTKYSQWRFKFSHDGQTKFGYVTKIGPDHYMFTSGSLSGRLIFTHYPVTYQGLQNLGITPPGGP